MKDLAYDPDERIAALATPWGEGALAVVRTTGEGSIDHVARVFSRPDAVRNAPGNTLIVGELLDAPGGSPVDQVIAAVYRAPKSYTGQESVELFCHGSPLGVTSVLDSLRKNGFRDAGPGEFTLRAFLNRKLDLTRAEAVREIVNAKSREAHALALHRLGGAVESRVNRAKERLLRLMSALEVQLDYPEDEVEGSPGEALSAVGEVRSDLASLAATYRSGRIFQEGVRVALCGRTNAGKSSLFNLLLREERSIVSPFHGTTRDYIESWISAEGIPVALFDTAGLRDSQNPIEAEGIRRSREVIESAHLIVYIVDAAAGLGADDRAFLAQHSGESTIAVWNKIDAASASPPPGFVPMSATVGTGADRLLAEIKRRVLGQEIAPSGDAVIDSERQRALLERCVEALRNVESGVAMAMPADAIALDLREALDALGEITGEVTTADVLNTMFAGFCVGK